MTRNSKVLRTDEEADFRKMTCPNTTLELYTFKVKTSRHSKALRVDDYLSCSPSFKITLFTCFYGTYQAHRKGISNI